MNQNAPPFRNSQAACLKFQKSPHHIGEYHAITIGTITKISPNKSSTHLFMVLSSTWTYLNFFVRFFTTFYDENIVDFSYNAEHIKLSAASMSREYSTRQSCSVI